MLVKAIAGILLIIIAWTWRDLSIQAGYWMPLTPALWQIIATLAASVFGVAAIDKWGKK